MNLEAEIIKTSRLPEALTKPLQVHFPTLYLGSVSVRVGSWLYRLGSMFTNTTAFVWRDMMHLRAGVINRAGTQWDFSHTSGWIVLAHELRHVIQWRRSPWRQFAAELWAIPRSLATGRLYNHDVIGFEQDAITFSQGVGRAFETKPKIFFEAFRAMQ